MMSDEEKPVGAWTLTKSGSLVYATSNFSSETGTKGVGWYIKKPIAPKAIVIKVDYTASKPLSIPVNLEEVGAAFYRLLSLLHGHGEIIVTSFRIEEEIAP